MEHKNFFFLGVLKKYLQKKSLAKGFENLKLERILVNSLLLGRLKNHLTCRFLYTLAHFLIEV